MGSEPIPAVIYHKTERKTMADSYFQIRDAERTAWFVSQNFHNIADVAAMITKTLDSTGLEDAEESISHVLKYAEESFKQISEEAFQISTQAFHSAPAGGLLVELDLRNDSFHCYNWTLPEKKLCTVSTSLSRIAGIYEMALTRSDPHYLDLDEFAAGILNHCTVKFFMSQTPEIRNSDGPTMTMTM